MKVDWNSLPVERDPSKTEYKSYSSGWGYPGWDDDDYYYGSNYGSRGSRYNSYNNWGSITKPKTKTDNVWFHDKKYNYVSKVEIEEWTKKVISVDLCKERIAEEKQIIDSLMVALEIDFKSSSWDGFKYKLNYENYSTDCDRNDLIEYLPELDYSKIEELGEEPNSMFDTDSYIDMCDGFYD